MPFVQGACNAATKGSWCCAAAAAAAAAVHCVTCRGSSMHYHNHCLLFNQAFCLCALGQRLVCNSVRLLSSVTEWPNKPHYQSFW
jgi:hypothetical protein